ncbi:MAG: hypothetical protein WA294_15185 [Acidobacteriaceae bacterium]
MHVRVRRQISAGGSIPGITIGKLSAKHTILAAQIMASRGHLRWVAPAVLIAAALLAFAFLRGGAAEAYQQRSGWLPISGNWTIHSGVISNPHYGRGDMMIIRRPSGSDYRISADLRFDLLFEETHYGDAGLIIRATDPRPGVDSYKGYYAGLRPGSQTVVLGRASYDWRLLSEAKLATPMASGDWYHLEIAARGCSLDVVAQPLRGGPSTQIHYRDPGCLASGVAGLRSFYADASWRNVQVASF